MKCQCQGRRMHCDVTQKHVVGLLLAEGSPVIICVTLELSFLLAQTGFFLTRKHTIYRLLNIMDLYLHIGLYTDEYYSRTVVMVLTRLL